MNSTASVRCRLAAGAVVTLAAGLAGCASNPAKQAQAAGSPPAVPVRVARVERRTVPLDIHTIGNVEPFSTVSLKSRVSAVVDTVNFREGQDVKKGELLFTLDQRPFVADLHQAEAGLERDVARGQNSSAQARRFADLFHAGVASRQQYDDAQATASADQATVRSDRAAIEAARLKVSFCTITSPIDGRVGGILVYPGNVVKENDLPVMVVINQIQPIFVSFNVPEQALPEVKRYSAAGRLAVDAQVPQQPGELERGQLTFMDNAVDRTTGTIRLKGTFANSQRRLWPGQFVNVTLLLSQEPDRIVVPNQAVQSSQTGQMVYVVRPDSTVEARGVTVARVAGAEAVIGRGLEPGETVVTDGQLRLVPGARVEIKNDSDAQHAR
ncbi:MAG TPA: efflux RND transporter periplasmic adaptor subunit [Candidatus Acidoferrales bacterium]|nr:efflux RND transporter periplasmic adaptor subunit [Candidatus Acidoferrales bacterium]